MEVRRVRSPRPFAWSFCDQDGNTSYVRVDVDPITREPQPLSKGDLRVVKDVYEDETIVKTFHNGRYDILMNQFAGVRTRGPVVDTMIVSHIATHGREMTYALKPLSKKYLEFEDTDQKALHQLVSKARQMAKKNRWSFATEEVGGRDPKYADYWLPAWTHGEDGVRVCAEYAIADTERTALLYQLWINDILQSDDKFNLFQREHTLFWVLKRMEDRGTRVFPKTVHKLRKFYQDYMQTWQATVEAEGGADLNPNSPTQMGEMFYEKRGHKPRYTETFNEKKGRCNYQLNGEQLLELANGYSYETRTERSKMRVEVPPDKLAKAVLEIRAAQQTISTFLDIYERSWSEEPVWSTEATAHPALSSSTLAETSLAATGPTIHVLHPNYKATGTITGRLSCSDPNLMQVASETTGRRKADIQSRPREAFGPRPDCYWYLPDYSQIEVWIFAFRSGEEKMQQALLSGHDFHGTIAKQVFGKYPDFETNYDYYRKCAKLIMFAKLYGGGPAKIAGLLKVRDKWVCREATCEASYDEPLDFCSECGEVEPLRFSAIDQAKVFIETYETNLPGVPEFMSRLMTQASREGTILNPFGREYAFEPDFAYKAVNYLIQGTAADVMKNALIHVDEMLQRKWNDEPRLLLTIHDEIIVEVPKWLHSKRLMTDIIRAMQKDQHKLKLPVPLPVEMKVVKPGDRWNNTTKFDKDLNPKGKEK
jgi:DNA polymerase-1